MCDDKEQVRRAFNLGLKAGRRFFAKQHKKPRVYILKNDGGMIVEIVNVGAAIRSIRGKDGVDVIFGYEEAERYMPSTKSKQNFCTVVGRFANRIANAEFELDGKKYRLEANNGKNSLHGGSKGFYSRVFRVERYDSKRIELTYKSPSGEMGYPGDMCVRVTYTLDNNNELRMEFSANASAATPCNLCHHAYFNLGGHTSGSVLDHELELMRSTRYTPVLNGIPTGKIESVIGTILDYKTKPRTLGSSVQELAKENSKLGQGTGGGLDFNFVIDCDDQTVVPPCFADSSKTFEKYELLHVASLRHPKSGRSLDIFTNQPGIQVYTANFVKKSSKVYQHCKGGATYDQYGAICLETQNYPDAINRKGVFPPCILRPGQIYRHVSSYRFKW